MVSESGELGKWKLIFKDEIMVFKTVEFLKERQLRQRNSKELMIWRLKLQVLMGVGDKLRGTYGAYFSCSEINHS